MSEPPITRLSMPQAHDYRAAGDYPLLVLDPNEAKRVVHELRHANSRVW